MTPKTKAHGWITDDWKQFLNTIDRVGLYKQQLNSGEIPVCLIKPDTVDRVREFVEAMRKRDLNQSEIYYAAELLKLLPEVE